MHTYMLNEQDGTWLVGVFAPSSLGDEEPPASTEVWHTLKVLNDEADAMRLVNYLNGGSGSPIPGFTA